MPNPELERLTAEATELIRRAVEIGIQMERTRVRELLSADAGWAIAATGSVAIHAAMRHRVRRTRGPSSRGPIALVRKAISEMPMSQSGADAAEIGAYHNQTNPESRLTDKQVRGALKQLVNTGEARRAARGRYLPVAAATPSVADEKSGENNSPDPFQLAAE
jgi:hypothetical protein